MKKLVVLLLCVCSLFTIFAVTGCGKASVSDIKKNFEKLDAAYASHSDVFTISDDVDDEFHILINYGNTRIDKNIQDNGNFSYLKKVYNTTLVIANQYVEKNREFVTKYDGKLSKQSKKSLDNLNESLESYIKSINSFAKAQHTLKDYCERVTDTSNDALHVTNFEKSYVSLVQKSVTLSVRMAEFVETTEILSLLKSTTPSNDDTAIVTKYIGAKLLPIFCDVRISQIGAINWDETLPGDSKERIQNLIDNLETVFTQFKNVFVVFQLYQTLDNQKMNDLFKLAEDFFVAQNEFEQALSGFNIKKFSVTYRNSMENYLKKNKLAEVYLSKMEQFVETVLPDFISQVDKMI